MTCPVCGNRDVYTLDIVPWSQTDVRVGKNVFRNTTNHCKRCGACWGSVNAISGPVSDREDREFDERSRFGSDHMGERDSYGPDYDWTGSVGHIWTHSLDAHELADRDMGRMLE